MFTATNRITVQGAFMEKKKLPIQLHVGGYAFRFTIDWKDEIYYRDAEKMLKHAYEEFHKMYPGKSVEEIWALLALQATITLNQKSEKTNIHPLAAKVKELNEQVQKLLNDEQ